MKLKDYIRGNRRGKEAHSLEREAMEDPFLHDALEGLDSVDADHGAAFDRLSARLADRLTRPDRVAAAAPPVPSPSRRGIFRRPAVWLSAAAVFVCLVISSVVYYRLLPNETGAEKQFAVAEETVPPDSVPSGREELTAGSQALPGHPQDVKVIADEESRTVLDLADMEYSTTAVEEASELTASRIRERSDIIPDQKPADPQLSEQPIIDMENVVITAVPQSKQKVTGGVRTVEKEENSLSQSAGRAPSPQPSPARNGVIPVSEYPVTYVGLHPDTSSYAVVRDAIHAGVLPRPSDITTVGLVNYFTYNFAFHSGREPVKIGFEAGPCPWNTSHRLAVIYLTALQAVEGAELLLEFDPAVVSSYSLVGNTAGSVVEGKPAGENLRAGHRFTLLCELTPTGTAGALATAKLSYNKNKRRAALKEVTVTDTGHGQSAEFYFATAVAMFGRLLAGIAGASVDDYDTILSYGRMGLANDADGKRSEFIRLVEAAREITQGDFRQ